MSPAADYMKFGTELMARLFNYTLWASRGPTVTKDNGARYPVILSLS